MNPSEAQDAARTQSAGDTLNYVFYFTNIVQVYVIYYFLSRHTDEGRYPLPRRDRSTTTPSTAWTPLRQRRGFSHRKDRAKHLSLRA